MNEWYRVSLSTCAIGLAPHRSGIGMQLEVANSSISAFGKGQTTVNTPYRQLWVKHSVDGAHSWIATVCRGNVRCSAGAGIPVGNCKSALHLLGDRTRALSTHF